MRDHALKANRTIPPTHPLYGRKVYVPRMAEGSSQMFAAIFRSLGLDAEVAPPSNARTLELGGKYSNGDECYPLKLTLGDFLRILEQPGTDPRKIAFFMATGKGPCRFGQYAPYIRRELDRLGYGDVAVFYPSCEQSYADFGEASSAFTRGAWRALLSADILRKLLLKVRPYGIAPGSADALYQQAVEDLCAVLEVPYSNDDAQMQALQACLLRIRNQFRYLARESDSSRPRIGVVGEIFCRLNDFSNQEMVRRLENAGAEVWMNDIGEWIWYVNSDQLCRLKLEGRRLSWECFDAHVRGYFQRTDEHALLGLFQEDFRGDEEPEDTQVILDLAEPYLPATGANGEMVLNVGKAVYFAEKGLDGVIDISPFTCMNGIVGEAIYPRVSRDHDAIPIRNFYFDGTKSDLERDIGIFIELSKSYRQRHSRAASRAALAHSLR